MYYLNMADCRPDVRLTDSGVSDTINMKPEVIMKGLSFKKAGIIGLTLMAVTFAADRKSVV